MMRILNILPKTDSNFDNDQLKPTFLYRIFYYLLSRDSKYIFE
jgi:hypothetical protein